MVGIYLKQYMVEQGILQKFISEKTGISLEKLGEILEGKQKMEVVEYFDICAAIGISPAQFAVEAGVYSVAKQDRRVVI